MKKTPLLIGLLVLSQASGLSNAQSSVSLYGAIDIGLNFQAVKAGSDPDVFSSFNQTGRQLAMASGQQSGSRWGLKGVQYLGDGLSANFVYESSITPNTGDSSGFTRQSTLGLSSQQWGSIDLGRRSAPSSYAFAGIDPFSNGFGQASLDSSMGTAFMRLSNMLMYTTPSLSGFSASAGYSFDTGLYNYFGTIEEASDSFGTSNKFRAISTGLRYANGPILVAGSLDVFLPNASLQGQPNYGTLKAWNVGATYDFQVVKLHAAYGQNIGGLAEGTNPLANAQTSGGIGNTNGGNVFLAGARTQSWMLGFTVPVAGNSSVFTSIQQMLPGGAFKRDFTDTMTVASIGYSYSLSKRTNLYAYYSYMDQAAMLKDTYSQALGIGIRHFF